LDCNFSNIFLACTVRELFKVRRFSIDSSNSLNYDALKKRGFMAEYTDKHARSGIDAPLPKLECFKNQFKNYEITISIPEYTSVCPRTGLPDFGTITICYIPDKWCVELKSLRGYILAYRNLGIFYENVVNRILRDFVKASKPIQAMVTGEFNVRGGMKSVIEVAYPSKNRKISFRSGRNQIKGKEKNS
jgi:7-cyano-7-deazaguanine reductase